MRESYNRNTNLTNSITTKNEKVSQRGNPVGGHRYNALVSVSGSIIWFQIHKAVIFRELARKERKQKKKKKRSLKVPRLRTRPIIFPLLTRRGLLASFELALTIMCHQQFYKLIRKNSLINDWLAIKWHIRKGGRGRRKKKKKDRKKEWMKPRVLSFHYHQLRANYKQIIYVFCCGL